MGVWQGLADADPDVDAIYRITSNAPCYLKEQQPVVLGKGTVSPFNTQNTMIRKELFLLMYLPTHTTFRFTDILRGFVAQPIMWLYDYLLGFTNATVVQKMNPHDYMKDFLLEIPIYEHGERIIDLVTGTISANKSVEANLYNAYVCLVKNKILYDKEIIVLEIWLEDLQAIYSI